MSPASITAFSTLIFGLTFAPMVTGKGESGNQPTQHNDKGQATTSLTFNQSAERGSRREPTKYEGNVGPSMLEVADDYSPYGRRTDVPIIDLRNLFPSVDEHDSSMKSSKNSAGKSTKMRSSGAQHSPTHSTRRATQSAAPRTNTPAKSTQSSGKSAGVQTYTYTYSVNSAPQSESSSMQQSTPQTTQHTAQTRRNAVGKSSSVTGPTRNTNKSAKTTTEQSVGFYEADGTQDGSEAQRGRRPIDPRAEKIAAPGSDLDGSKAAEAQSRSDETQSAPSASAGKKTSKNSASE